MKTSIGNANLLPESYGTRGLRREKIACRTLVEELRVLERQL